MKNLTIHRLALGMLTAFVLAFSVQGTVEAQKTVASIDSLPVGTISSKGTLVVYSIDGTEDRKFTITVNKAADGDTIKIGDTNTTNATISDDDITVPKNAKNESGTVSSGTITFDAPGERDLDSDSTYGETFSLTFKSRSEVTLNLDINGDGDKLDTSVSAVLESEIGFSLNNDTDTTDYLTSVSEATADKDLNADGDKTDTFTRNATLYEEKSNWTWSGSITVEYATTGYGPSKVVVSAPNFEPTAFTVDIYVARTTNQARQWGIVANSSNTTTTPQVNHNSAFSVQLSSAATHTQVDLSISSGGKFYLDSGDYLESGRLKTVSGQRKYFTGSSLKLFTGGTTPTPSTTVSVESTNIDNAFTATATVPGSVALNKKYTITYLASSTPTLENRSGNHQFGRINTSTGAAGNQLSNPLVVRVLDGHGGKSVPGVWVRFNLSASNDETLRASTLGLIWDNNGDNLINASDNNQAPLVVKTNSSGEAKVYVVPGTQANTYTITYEIPTQTSPTTLSSPNLATSSTTATDINVQFTATAVQNFANHYIAPGSSPNHSTTTPQSFYGQRNTVKTMQVFVTDGSNLQDNVQVAFSVTGGQISRDGVSYGNSVTTVSDSNGVAKVDVKTQGAIFDVRAVVVGSNHQNSQYTVTYFFDTPRIEIVSGDNQYGTIGGRVEDPLVVRVLDGTGGRAVPNQIVRFQVTNQTGDNGSNERQFIPVPNTDVFVTAADRNIFDDAATARPTIGSPLRSPVTYTKPRATVDTGANDNGQNIFIQTDDQGQAEVYLRLAGDTDLNTAGVQAPTLAHVVTATTPDGAPTNGVQFNATAVEGKRSALLEIISGDGQSADKGRKLAEPLVVRVRTTQGYLAEGVPLEFVALDGTLEPNTDHGTHYNAGFAGGGGGNRIEVETESDGQASVWYNVGQLKVPRQVTVEVIAERGALQYDFQIDEVKFGVNGGQGTGGTTDPTTVTPYLRLSVSPSSGAAGATGTLTVTAHGSTGSAVSGIPVNLSATGVTLPSSVTSGQSTSFTFPNSSTTVSARATGYTSTSTQITVTQPTTGTSTTSDQVASTLAIVSGNSQVVKTNQTLDPFVVEVKDQKGKAMSGVEVLFQTGGAGTLSSSKATTGSNGQATTTLSLPTTQRDFVTYTVYATVIGVEGLKQQFTVIARKPVLSRLQTRSGNLQTGFVGERLAEPLEVQVLDTDDDPVSGVQVTFIVLSEESTGTATPLTQSDQSDTGGYAGARITPTGAGAIQIQASVEDLTPVQISFTATLPPSRLVKVSGNDQNAGPGNTLKDPFVVEVQDANGSPVAGITVSFKVTAGGGQVSARSAVTDTYGRAQTTLTLGKERGQNTVEANVAGMPLSTTFGAISGAQVHVGAAQRPSLYWVDTKAGTLQRLVGDRVESIAPNIRNATHLVVDADGGKIYWAAQTAKNAGRIWRANLNGTNPEKIRDLAVAPMGLALDAAGGRLYWTNPRGRIHSMSTSGGKITNIRQNLPKPTAIALSNGVLYWGQAGGSVRRMNLTGNKKVVSNIAKGGEPLDIAIGKGKVYWTEKTAENAGRIRRANLDGSNVQNVKALSSIPIGIVVDATDNKIYWTNSRARLKRSNLVGGKIQNVVTDLVSPGILTLGGGEIAEETPVVRQPTQPTQTTTQPTTYSKYDINKDGAVNNKDTRLVAAAVGQSGAAITNTRTDVDSSGTVDVTDLILVIGNLDDDAAAPMLDLDLKAMDLDFDRVQEQIEALLASGDRSIAAQRALLYLQHLLASARPDETVLLANYPNPFNPETWIPYHLAESTDVEVRIYDAQGTLVRVLTLGHQTAGYYTSRSRAAYWNGRNALGERVASGVYFYQLQTDAISPMRKMVILK